MQKTKFAHAALTVGAVLLGAAVVSQPAFAQSRSGAVQSSPLGVAPSAPAPAPSPAQEIAKERLNDGRITARARAQADDEARAKARAEISPPTGLKAAPPLDRNRTRPRQPN
jgi:hypothetical protein